MGTPHHSLTITCFVNRFFCSTTPQTTHLQLASIYKVKRKIHSLELRSAPGNDGITPLIYAISPEKPLLIWQSYSNNSCGWDTSPPPGRGLKLSPSLNPINLSSTLTHMAHQSSQHTRKIIRTHISCPADVLSQPTTPLTTRTIRIPQKTLHCLTTRSDLWLLFQRL